MYSGRTPDTSSAFFVTSALPNERVESLEAEFVQTRPTPSTQVTFSSAEVRRLNPRVPIGGAAQRKQEQPVQPASASAPVARVTGEEEEIDFVVYRTGRLDRTLPRTNSGSRDERRAITNPVYRDYPELADLTEWELKDSTIHSHRQRDGRLSAE